ncbi:MAG TPA: hypothetical protein VEH31_15850 [Streptosporangiaceae bacterium]|nr:hypothetical protein [Streptosporangiaceae bacterium]
MTRLRKSLAVAAMALIIGPVAAGCGGSGPVSGAVSSAASAARSAASSLRPSGSASVGLPTSAPTPTAQEPVTSQAPAPTTAAAASPAAGESGSSLLWLWIALAALVVIGLIVWIARASGRRSAAAAGWRSAVIDTYAKGQALADAVRIADRPGGPSAAGAGAGWAGLQARADELSRELYRLREGARAEEDRMRVDDTLTSLRGLRSAMADEQAAGGAGGPGSPEAAQVRGRLMSFEETLRALRAPYEQMPRI